MELASILEFLQVMFADFDIMEVLGVLLEVVGGLVGGIFQ